MEIEVLPDLIAKQDPEEKASVGLRLAAAVLRSMSRGRLRRDLVLVVLCLQLVVGPPGSLELPSLRPVMEHVRVLLLIEPLLAQEALVVVAASERTRKDSHLAEYATEMSMSRFAQ